MRKFFDASSSFQLRIGGWKLKNGSLPLFLASLLRFAFNGYLCEWYENRMCLFVN